MKIKLLLTTFLLLLSQLIVAQAGDTTGFSNTFKYNWFTPQDRYDYRENLTMRSSLINEYESSKIDVWKNMERSLILPGTGHFHTGNYVRGMVFLCSEIALATTSIYLINEGKKNHDQYQKATQIDEINRLFDKSLIFVIVFNNYF